MLGGKIALVLASVLVLTLTGYAWASFQGLVKGLTLTDVIGEGGGGEKPADGARDILLVGLDSRTDAQGNPLPRDMLKELNAGKDEGVLNTDTLILVHIPNDGSKAVAVSLPRDSYVDVPGFGMHKINSAYARGKAAQRQQLQAEGVTDPRDIELRSNQEGAKTLIATVERFTGRTIDNYAAINLLGFYQITKAVGGVDVCLKAPVNDVKSHANFEAGHQTVSGADALAFVRQRHGLPRGDLDRVVRQQVFMAGLARKILSAGTLADPNKLNDLMDAIKKSIVLNQGWDVIGFAQQLSGLTGGQIEFHTIPVLSLAFRTPADGVAVQVDPNQVQEFIGGLSGSVPTPQQETSADDAERNAEITVNVMNTTATSGLAASVSGALAEQGFTEGLTGNANPRDTTVVRYATGEQDIGQRVADALHGAAIVEEDPALSPGQVTVLLGTDYPTDSVSAGNGGGSQPQGHPRQEPPPSDAPAEDPDGSDEPITAHGVTCVN